jgi:hypothetical protein
MSSADNSPGTYLGNLAAGKIDNNEMPATIRKDGCNARRRASSLIVTALSTCPGVAEVAPSTVLGDEVNVVEEDLLLELGRQLESAQARSEEHAQQPTATTLANAAVTMANLDDLAAGRAVTPSALIPGRPDGRAARLDGYR